MDDRTFSLLFALRDGEADGNAILDRITALPGRRTPSVPTLYRSLRTLLERGWVAVERTEETTSAGRPPQVYRLTADGREALEQEGRRLLELATAALGEVSSSEDPR